MPEYFYSTSNPIGDEPLTNSNFGASLPIGPQGVNVAPYTECTSCNDHTIEGEEPQEGLEVSTAERVAQAEIGNTEEGDNVWKAKKSLFESLGTDSAVLDSSAIVETFYDTTGANAIGKLAEAAEAIAAIADTTIADDSAAVAQRVALAMTKNDEVDALVIPEENEKAINLFYLNSYAQGRYELTGGEIAQLTSIANQCPYTGGYAVYTARDILRGLNPFITFNDQQACSGYSARKAKAIQQSMKLKDALRVYPNPTTGMLTIEYKKKINVAIVLKLQNTIGNDVRLEHLILNEGNTQYDISDLQPAVYFYKAFMAGEFIASGKIVLIK